MLVMSVLDGNVQIFPLAVAVAEGENEDTWMWFLALVCSALNIDNDNGGAGMVVLSDREKGLANAMRTLLPRAAHSPCVFHIQKNVKTRFKTALNGLLFKAAKAADDNAFLDAMAGMRRLHGAATDYVSATDQTRWARAFFPSRMFGMSRLTCPNQ